MFVTFSRKILVWHYMIRDRGRAHLSEFVLKTDSLPSFHYSSNRVAQHCVAISATAELWLQ